MRYLLAAVVLLLVGAAAPQSPMPPPGNPNHERPAPDAFCRHPIEGRAADPAHDCACEKSCHQNEDGTFEEVEDYSKCRAWCFKDKCHCGMACS